MLGNERLDTAARLSIICKTVWNCRWNKRPKPPRAPPRPCRPWGFRPWIRSGLRPGWSHRPADTAPLPPVRHRGPAEPRSDLRQERPLHGRRPGREYHGLHRADHIRYPDRRSPLSRWPGLRYELLRPEERSGKSAHWRWCKNRTRFPPVSTKTM